MCPMDICHGGGGGGGDDECFESVRWALNHSSNLHRLL